MFRRATRRLLAPTAAAVLLAGPAGAVGLGFDCITDNLASDCAIGEAQLVLDVTDPGGSQALFTFRNLGPEASSITDVYFDDGALLGIATLSNTPGLVEFSLEAAPGNLPGANQVSPPFVTTGQFSADANSPTQPLGVNPGESLGISFDLQAGLTFADVVEDLADGSLRVGIHVQGFATEGSESFVNVPVPEPGSGALALAGLAALVAGRHARARLRPPGKNPSVY